MKNVLLFEKSGKSGHREYIGETIKKNLKTGNLNVDFVLAQGEKINLLEYLEAYKNNKKIDHCHILTLDDCIFDFYDSGLLNRFLKLKISLTATLFDFRALQVKKNIYYYLKNCLPGYPSEQSIIYDLLRKKIIKTLFIPDERARNIFLYPICNSQLKFLPDFSNLEISKLDQAEARQRLGLENNFTFLMFGEMRKYKGLDLLLEVINKGMLNKSKKINIIIAGKSREKRIIQCGQNNIRILDVNDYIENSMANILFSAADCVLLPFEKTFRLSSGTFSTACAFGSMVIVNNGGILEWRVKKYQNGLVFKSGSPQALSTAMNKILGDQANIRAMKAGSLKYAETCSVTRYMKILKNNFLENK